VVNLKFFFTLPTHTTGINSWIGSLGFFLFKKYETDIVILIFNRKNVEK